MYSHLVRTGVGEVADVGRAHPLMACGKMENLTMTRGRQELLQPWPISTLIFDPMGAGDDLLAELDRLPNPGFWRARCMQGVSTRNPRHPWLSGGCAPRGAWSWPNTCIGPSTSTPDAPTQFQQSQTDGHARRRGAGPDARIRPRRAARPYASADYRSRAQGKHPAGRGPRLRDFTGPAGAGRIHHCMRSIGKAGAGASTRMVKRGHAHGVRQADHSARQEPRGRRSSRPHRDRGDAADGAEGGQGDGRAGQPGSARLDQHGQGHGARTGVHDHRPGDSDP